MMSDVVVPGTNPSEMNALNAIVVRYTVIRTNGNLCILKFNLIVAVRN